MRNQSKATARAFVLPLLLLVAACTQNDAAGGRPTSEENKKMSQDYQLEFVELSPQLVLVVERESSPQDLGSNLADILPRVHAYITQQGQEPAGAPFMRYLDMTDRFLMDAGLPIAARIDGEGDIELRELPGGTAVTALFTGPSYGVGAAWSAVFAYAEKHGYKRGSEWKGMGGWDVYVNDPAVVGADKAQTRLYLPVPEK